MSNNRTIVYRCRNYITHVCPEVVWAAGHTCKKCIEAGNYPKDEGPYKGEWPPKRRTEPNVDEQQVKEGGPATMKSGDNNGGSRDNRGTKK